MLAHVDMDAFYASVEVRDRPALAGKPVIVGGGMRGVVSAASYQARRWGVRSAMPMYQARRLCPQGVFLPVRMARYRQVSRQVMEVLSRFSPLLEPVSVDEAYLDLGGTEGLWGPPRQAGETIKRAVREATGLTCSVGLAPLRFLAKIASDRDKPDGLTVVEDVESFLETVSLAEVPGVGQSTRRRLEAMGIRRLVEVRGLGPDRLERALGAMGLRLWDLARGVDPRGVTPRRAVKSLSHEVTLARDTADRERLEAVLLGLCQRLCRRLRRQGLSGRVVTLKLKHADMRLVTRRQSLPRPCDQAGPLFRAARHLLGAYGSPGPFRLIGVGISGLEPSQRQVAELFRRREEERQAALARAEDQICRRFGEQALTRARILTAGERSPKPRP